jgi:hypothetical protein
MFLERRNEPLTDPDLIQVDAASGDGQRKRKRRPRAKSPQGLLGNK